MTDCIFCKIAAGEIPATKVYEDDYVLAFDDLYPMMPVHTLVIPKQHVEHIGGEMSDELKARLFSAIGEVARIKGVAETGYRVVTNAGKNAGQTVFHLHFHILGGARMNDGNPSL